MARLPKNPAQAVALLNVQKGAKVVAFGPGNGYAEALGEAVGPDGKVMVADPPPDLEASGNVEVVGERPEARGDAVLVWIGPVPAHRIREFPELVTDEGSLWVVLPRGGKGPVPTNEADVKRSLLAAGWKSAEVVALATDLYAVRFHRRRSA